MKEKITYQHVKQAKEAREAALIILYISSFQKSYASDLLALWKESTQPKEADYRLCYQVTLGTLQNLLALSHCLHSCSHKKSRLKKVEKYLLFLSLYQKLYLEKIPLYAIVSEGNKLIKRFASRHFQKYFHACLHRVEKRDLDKLKQSQDFESQATYYSFPLKLAQDFAATYGEKGALALFKAFHSQSTTHIRYRKAKSSFPYPQLLANSPFPVFALPPEKSVQDFLFEDYYLQNATPIALTLSLTKKLLKVPCSFLDLCASPGGKSFLIHDLYPGIAITMNEPDKKRLLFIQENLKRLNITPSALTQKDGRKYPLDKLFDLVLLDVPCSNTGVLHKRPEARYRYEEGHENLLNLQKTLLSRGAYLVANKGHLMYMTCSLSSQENHQQVVTFLKNYPRFKLIQEKTLLPNEQGFDGGYGALLQAL